MGKGIGLKPSEFAEGGGLLDNITAKWKQCRFVMWDYNGNGPMSPALKVTMDVDGDEAEQYWSAGRAEDWAPSKDGTTLVSVGTARGINKGSNLAILISSIIEAGFPEDKLDDNCTVFEGMVAHMVRVPAPKRTGIVKTPRADGKTFEATILVVDKIEQLPGEKKGAKTTAKAGTATAPDGGGEEFDIEAFAKDTVMEILMANDGSMSKADMSKAVFQKLKTGPNRNAVVQLVYKDSWLGEQEWTFDGKTITI